MSAITDGAMKRQKRRDRGRYFGCGRGALMNYQSPFLVDYSTILFYNQEKLS